MLTIDQVRHAVKSDRVGYNRAGSAMLDSRDYSRLVNYFPVDEWEALGFALKEGSEPPPLKPWTREQIVADMAADLAFAFEKALNKRGISASLMNEVMKMWMWVLDDDLRSHDDYPQYGLPLLKAIAMKYDLPNEIGDDIGNEYKYAST